VSDGSDEWEDYESGPFCAHWGDFDCPCVCGHSCGRHDENSGPCEECDCKAFDDKRYPAEEQK